MLHVADFLGLWYSCSSVFYLIINPCILHQDWLNTLLGERKILQVFSLTGLQKSFCVIGVEVDWFPPIIDRSNASNLSKNSDKQYHFTEMKKYHKKGYHHSFYVLFSNAISYSQPLLSEWSVGQDGKSGQLLRRLSPQIYVFIINDWGNQSYWTLIYRN